MIDCYHSAHTCSVWKYTGWSKLDSFINLYLVSHAHQHDGYFNEKTNMDYRRKSYSEELNKPGLAILYKFVQTELRVESCFRSINSIARIHLSDY